MRKIYALNRGQVGRKLNGFEAITHVLMVDRILFMTLLTVMVLPNPKVWRHDCFLI